MFRIVFPDGRERVSFLEESAQSLYNEALFEAGLGAQVATTVAPEPGLVGLVTTYTVSAA